MLSALVTDDLRCSGPKGDIVALLVAREHVLDEVAAGHEHTLVREPDASTRRSRLLQCVRLPLSTYGSCSSSSADVADLNAPCRAEIEVAPAFDAAPVDLQMPAGLPADRADPPPASQPDGHDDRLHADADVATSHHRMCPTPGPAGSGAARSPQAHTRAPAAPSARTEEPLGRGCDRPRRSHRRRRVREREIEQLRVLLGLRRLG